ncbi:MAG TPA: DUF3237 family protein [Polyangiaceae bacterium]|jgi:hypothetical protein
MELSPLGTMTITMGESVFMANVPSGTRLVIDFADIVVKGPRLDARKAPNSPAGDWLILGPGNVATLDIRMLRATRVTRGSIKCRASRAGRRPEKS